MFINRPDPLVQGGGGTGPVANMHAGLVAWQEGTGEMIFFEPYHKGAVPLLTLPRLVADIAGTLRIEQVYVLRGRQRRGTAHCQMQTCAFLLSLLQWRGTWPDLRTMTDEIFE